jgi:ABC-type transporter Mla MlaB component
MDRTPRNYVKFHSAHLKRHVTRADTGAVPAVTLRIRAPDQIMKTRKQHTPVKKRADRRPPKRSTQQRRAGAARAKTPPAAALKLAAQCTVAEADALKTALARLIAEATAVTLDVSALQRIDTAGLQLLAAFVRDRRAARRAVEWRGRAPALDAAAKLLGLHGMLQLPSEDG